MHEHEGKHARGKQPLHKINLYRCGQCPGPGENKAQRAVKTDQQGGSQSDMWTEFHMEKSQGTKSHNIKCEKTVNCKNYSQLYNNTNNRHQIDTTYTDADNAV